MTTESPKMPVRALRARRRGRLPIRLRPGEGSDAELLVGHRRAMFAAIGGFTEKDLAEADPVYRKWIRARLRSGRAEAVMAESEGRILGSAVVWYRDDQPRPGSPALRAPYLMSVYVEPEFRGRGIATRLTSALVARA